MFWLKFSPLLGKYHISLSLSCYLDASTCLLWKKWCAISLGCFSLLCDGRYLVKEGFVLLSSGIGKEFSAYC
jgi:hypothetical protein